MCSPTPSKEEVRSKCRDTDTKLPDLAIVKDFLRFYIHTSQPGLTTSTTTDLMRTICEWFFAGFARVTKTAVPDDVKSEVYSARPSLPVLT